MDVTYEGEDDSGPQEYCSELCISMLALGTFRLETKKVLPWVRQEELNGDNILSPPFYALTNRPLLAD
jgi:hypothetical protein